MVNPFLMSLLINSLIFSVKSSDLFHTQAYLITSGVYTPYAAPCGIFTDDLESQQSGTCNPLFYHMFSSSIPSNLNWLSVIMGLNCTRQEAHILHKRIIKVKLLISLFISEKEDNTESNCWMTFCNSYIKNVQIVKAQTHQERNISISISLKMILCNPIIVWSMFPLVWSQF